MKKATDISEQIALVIYGKTDRANAQENTNPDFQAGYAHGLEIKLGTVMAAIAAEWQRRGHPALISPSFREWKRGLWAAVTQSTLAEIEAIETELRSRQNLQEEKRPTSNVQRPTSNEGGPA